MTTTLNVRGIDRRAAVEIKRAARARGLTIGRYLERLVEAHEALRRIADDGGTTQAVVVDDVLRRFGLGTVKA